MTYSQKKLIKSTDWDNLIILDACRFDYFEQIYDDYLEGDLRRVKSAGTGTPDWLRNTFGMRSMDVAYISGTPMVSSKGARNIDGFHNGNNFKRIIDAWKMTEKYRPRPETIYKAVMVSQDLYSDKRRIIHFLQPHYPYLNLQDSGMTDIVLKFFYKKINSNSYPLGYIAWRYGEKNLKKHYKKILERVLETVSNLVEHLDGKVVISSDHGEMLGESGRYGHSGYERWSDFDHPILRNVPWLEVGNCSNSG